MNHDELVEAVALTILNSDRERAGLPPVESRATVPDSDGYVVNARAVEPLIRADERKRVEVEIADRMLDRADGCHVSDRLFAQEHYRTVAADIRAGDYRKGEA